MPFIVTDGLVVGACGPDVAHVRCVLRPPKGRKIIRAFRKLRVTSTISSPTLGDEPGGRDQDPGRRGVSHDLALARRLSAVQNNDRLCSAFER